MIFSILGMRHYKKPNSSFAASDIISGLYGGSNDIKLYKGEAEKTKDKGLKKALLLLKKEEDSHYSLISSWIEYYDRPHLWLEQAEFTHLEEF